MRPKFWYAILIFGMVSGCGYFKGEKGESGEVGTQGPQGEQGEKGDPGDAGDPGASGMQGPRGVPGERGDSGMQGAPGERGPIGEPGRMDRLMEGSYSCTGRYEYDQSKNWFRLRLNVWSLYTGERFLNGRSDFFRYNGGFIPDSGSGFGDSLETGSFRFEVAPSSQAWKWTHLRTGTHGLFNCQDPTQSK